MKKRDQSMKILLLSFLLCVTIHQLSAQNQPSIFKIFEQYGGQEGVTRLEASAEVMQVYGIVHFKSLIFKDGKRALADIRNCIEKDKVGAYKMKETLQDGKVVNGYYRLKNENSQRNRYLIFKVGKENPEGGKEIKVTLLYIEGDITPEQLVELLK